MLTGSAGFVGLLLGQSRLLCLQVGGVSFHCLFFVVGAGVLPYYHDCFFGHVRGATGSLAEVYVVQCWPYRVTARTAHAVGELRVSFYESIIRGR
jgi:hypothetical protein